MTAVTDCALNGKAIRHHMVEHDMLADPIEGKN